MRVAIVHDWLTAMRGGERCLEVFCELFPDADLYTLVYLPDRVSAVIRSMKVHPSWLNSLPGVRSYYRHCLPLFPRTIENFDLSGYDLVLSSSHCVAKGVSCPDGMHISYVYSPMRYIWDLHDTYFGPDSPWGGRMGMALCRPFLQRGTFARPKGSITSSRSPATSRGKLAGFTIGRRPSSTLPWTSRGFVSAAMPAITTSWFRRWRRINGSIWRYGRSINSSSLCASLASGLKKEA
jgi:hypothetical protein